MLPTPIGLVLIPLGIICLFWRPNWLYGLMVFFAPFSATSVINSGSGDAGAGLQPSIYFAMLLVSRSILEFALTLKIKVAKRIRKPLALVSGFGLACLVSLIMPIVAEGRINVMSAGLLNAPLEPLHFKSTNITWIFAIFLGIWLATLVAQKNLDPRNFVRTIRIYLGSGVFICAWGMMQCIFFALHIPYPAAVFNNSASPYALGYDKSIGDLNLARVSSVALEPSLLALVLVGMLPMMIIAVFGRYRIYGKILDRAVLALFFATLVLTTSSTGYLSFAIMYAVLSYTLIRYRSISIGRIFLLASPVFLAVFGFLASSSVRNLLDEVLLSKSDSWSALERGTVVLNDFQYFRQYPILGLGWGSAPAHDLIMGILANSGIVGLGTFLSFIFFLLLALYRRTTAAYVSRKPFNPSHVMLLVLIATCVAFAVAAIPGGPIFWLVIGLAVAATRMEEGMKNLRSGNDFGLSGFGIESVQHRYSSVSKL